MEDPEHDGVITDSPLQDGELSLRVNLHCVCPFGDYAWHDAGMIVLPPPPPPAFAHQHHALSAGNRQAYLRDFRRDFPELASRSDAEVLTAAADLAEAAEHGWRWPVLLADAQVKLRCSPRSAAGVVSLTVALLAPDRIGHLSVTPQPPAR